MPTSTCASLPALAWALAGLALAVLPGPARADAVHLQSSGVFSAETPLTSFSAPGAAWSLSLVLDRQPTPVPEPNLTFVGALVTVPFIHFEMLVDGVAVGAPSHVILYNAAEGGGMDLIFGGIQVEPVYRFDSLGTFGGQYYSGSELAPTLEPGHYPTLHPEESGLYVSVDNVRHWQAANMVTISAVPMPGSVWLMGVGLAALAPLVRRTPLAWRRRPA